MVRRSEGRHPEDLLLEAMHLLPSSFLLLLVRHLLLLAWHLLLGISLVFCGELE